MNILVLGHRGMLGHMAVKYLRDRGYLVETTEFKFPTPEFSNFVKNYKGDYIVNCIGAIPQKTKQFSINSELPIWLTKNTNCKVIHPGTDCEMDDDDYGISKKIASNYIKNHSVNTRILKASIIGPEINTSYSLLDWFLSRETTANGYTKAMWNGITTLEWAKQCERLLHNWDSFQIETIISSDCISKYALLSKVKAVFSKDVAIVAVDNVGSNKCLKADVRASDIEVQLVELKNFYYKI